MLVSAKIDLSLLETDEKKREVKTTTTKILAMTKAEN